MSRTDVSRELGTKFAESTGAALRTATTGTDDAVVRARQIAAGCRAAVLVALVGLIALIAHTG